MSLFIPITKVDVAKQLVYGTLTEEVPDKTGEILDYESAKPAFREWSDQFREASGGKSLGNVRAMHGSVAAGKLTDISFDDDNRRIEGVAKIVDDDEWQKVLEGVYTGFSIGGGYARRWPDTKNPELMRYTPILSEVSLVDNPAVPTATFEVIKQDGSTECRKFISNHEAPVTDTTTDTDPSDDTRIDTLIDDLAWLAQCAEEDNDSEIQPHIAALQAYLNGDDGDMDDDMEYGGEDDDDTSSHAYAGELARLARSESFSPTGRLEKRLVRMTAQLDTLQKRLARLEAQPLPGKGVMRAIGKSDDRAVLEDAFAKLSPADRARELMKVALSNPLQI
jgi:hypothetical protein